MKSMASKLCEVAYMVRIMWAALDPPHESNKDL